MAQMIKIKRGLNYKIERESNLAEGELGLATDEAGRVYVGTLRYGNVLVNGKEFLKISGGTLKGNLILPRDPTLDLHAATKQYVDSMAQGLVVEEPVKVTIGTKVTLRLDDLDGNKATISDLGLEYMDGYKILRGDRILLIAQGEEGGSAKENGIWIIDNEYDSSGEREIKRAPNLEVGDELAKGLFVYTENGTLKAGSGWILQAKPDGTNVVVGIDDIIFIQMSGGGVKTFGALSDTPGYDATHKNKIVTLNTDGNGIVYKDNNAIGSGAGKLLADMPDKYPHDSNSDTLYILGASGEQQVTRFIRVMRRLDDTTGTDTHAPISSEIMIEHNSTSGGIHGIPSDARFLHTQSPIDGGTFE
jgi:hypothetical protein